MSHLRIRTAAICLIGSLWLCACLVSSPDIGRAPGEPPPRLRLDERRQGMPLAWENLESFGPVPPELQMQGDLGCSALDTRETKYRAAGYHPHALSFDGSLLPEGGFYCQEIGKPAAGRSLDRQQDHNH